MVLIDTSVWIRAIRGLGPWASDLYHLLRAEKAVGHELVFGELLIGDKGRRGELLSIYMQMHQAEMVSHNLVVQFVRHRKFHGRGISWIDAHLLASAIAGQFQLWTADTNLTAIAKEMGVNWK